MLQRSTNNGTTTLTVYPFGNEEYHYTAGGTLQSSLHYDDLGGQLVDERSGSTTTMLLTDALGSVISTFSNTQNNAAVLGNQLYGPYGNQRLQAGSIDNTTSRGFTGQDNDTVTGLDYYGARYYDPAAGVFLSADSVEGNAVSMNPYGYVGGNPETMSDPTGQYVGLPGQEGNFVAQVSASEIPSDFYDAFANDSLSATDPTISDETASTGNTTYTEDPTTDEITQTVNNANGSSTTSSLYPTDTGYQKAAGAFNNPASDGQLHPVNGGILEAQYGIRHKPGAGELAGGSTTSSQSGQGPKPQVGGNGQGNRPPTTKPTAPSPEGPGPGRMNPQKIRFTQSTCSNVTGKYTVQGNIQGLQDGTLSPEQMGDPIRVFQKQSGMNGLTAKKGKFGPTSFANLADGEWYSLDNRRLYAFQAAGIADIPVEDVSGDIPFIISKSGRFTTTNYGTDIELRC